LAPTLQAFAEADWNFMATSVGSSETLIGREYAKAEEAAWRMATKELKALLAVTAAARAASWHDCSGLAICERCRRLDRSLSRLERLVRRGSRV
jgi:hypothetical protein